MAEGLSDCEKELLIEEEHEQVDDELSSNERFMDLLVKMNDNICELGVANFESADSRAPPRWSGTS